MTTEEATLLLIKYLTNKSPELIIHYYHSYTSNSIYLKLDYGAANSVRISDHDKSDNDLVPKLLKDICYRLHSLF